MNITKIILLVGCIFLMNSNMAQELKIATYNIRYSIEGNHKQDSVKGEDWKSRGPVVAALIRFHKFDIFGTQEGLLHQLNDIVEWAPNYQFIGVGRDDGKQAGEHAAIFYLKNKFQVVKHGDFWLSETPDKPSKGWDATCCNRLCSWALFKELKSGEEFYVFNAHFDHQGIEARKESAVLILHKIGQIAGDNPVIFMGDLNGDHESDWYKALEKSELLNDTYQLVEDPYAVNGSFNGFGRSTESNSIIDHVFVTYHFSARKWGLLTDTFHGRFPSDHFPVVINVTLGEP